MKIGPSIMVVIGIAMLQGARHAHINAIQKAAKELSMDIGVRRFGCMARSMLTVAHMQRCQMIQTLKAKAIICQFNAWVSSSRQPICQEAT